MGNLGIPSKQPSASPVRGLVVQLRAISDCLEDNAPRDEEGSMLTPFSVFLDYVWAIEKVLVAASMLYIALEGEDGC